MKAETIIRSPIMPDMGLLAAGSFTAGLGAQGPALWLGLGVAALAGLRLAGNTRRPPDPLLREELHGPFQSLSGFAELLVRASPEAERAEYAEGFSASLRALKTAIDASADLGRLEAGELRLVSQDNDAAELLGVALKAAATLAREKGVALSADALPRRNLPGDAARLIQIFGGLLRFGLKQAQRGHMLHLSISQRRRGLAFHLPAPGAGLALRTRSDAGLCLAQGLARLHGGELRASRGGLALVLPHALRRPG
jgi:hypothetical protein